MQSIPPLPVGAGNVRIGRNSSVGHLLLARGALGDRLAWRPALLVVVGLPKNARGTHTVGSGRRHNTLTQAQGAELKRCTTCLLRAISKFPFRAAGANSVGHCCGGYTDVITGQADGGGLTGKLGRHVLIFGPYDARLTLRQAIENVRRRTRIVDGGTQWASVFNQKGGVLMDKKKSSKAICSGMMHTPHGRSTPLGASSPFHQRRRSPPPCSQTVPCCPGTFQGG